MTSCVPAEEVTSCVPAEEVSELGLLSNLIYVFQDIEAEHIRFNHKEDAFRLHPQASGAVKKFSEDQ